MVKTHESQVLNDETVFKILARKKTDQKVKKKKGYIQISSIFFYIKIEKYQADEFESKINPDLKVAAPLSEIKQGSLVYIKQCSYLSNKVIRSQDN